jgi:hypothetical protein
MRIKFDEKMRQSNEWYIQEQMAAETARRIAQQNEYKYPHMLLLRISNSHASSDR